MTHRRCGSRALVVGVAIAVLAGCQPTIGGGTTRRINEETLATGPPSVSADGRFVTYIAVPPDAPEGAQFTQVFLWDRRTARTTQLTDGDNSSHYPSVSAHGEVVTFQSGAADLVPDDTNHTTDVFVWERATGAVRGISHAASDSGGGSPAMTDDGRYVSFHSWGDLVPDDAYSGGGTYVWDRITGELEFVPPGSCHGAGNTLSQDGRYATYSTAGGWAGEDPDAGGDVYLCDRVEGTTTRVTAGNGASFVPVISGDGRYVAFTSRATDLVPGDTNGAADVFVWSRATGVIERISDLRPFKYDIYYATQPRISDDGRVVVYATWADGAAWAGGGYDVFRWDRATDATSTITDGNSMIELPAMSGDGRIVAYQSGESDLVPDGSPGLYLWTAARRR